MAATYPPGPVPTTTTSYFIATIRCPSHEEAERLLEKPLHVLQEASAHRAVHHAVVARDRHLHPAADPDLAMIGDRLLDHRAHRQDGALRRIDDRGKLLDVVHAEVRDGERRAAHLG